MSPQRLTFDALRAANKQRLPLFRNARGMVVHNQPDGMDWLLSQWSNALGGEFGESANIIKKIERGDFALDDLIPDDKSGEMITVRQALADELSDIQTYLDILALRAGIDLGEATISKFNRVSEWVGVDVRLADGPQMEICYSKPHSEFEYCRICDK